MTYRTDASATDPDVNLIERWYEAQDETVQAAFDYMLRLILATNDLTDSKQFKALERQHAGLWEVVVEVRKKNGKKRQIRPVGFWDTNQMDFILVNACEKCGRFTVPPGVFDAALVTKSEFFYQAKGTIHEYTF